MYSTISPLIQSALTPVFMLSAIGMTLAVIDTRLNRVVDRIRVLEDRISADPRRALHLAHQINFFMLRAGRITIAASLCTLASVFVALSIVGLFVDGLIATSLTLPVEAAFTCAVLSYCAALLIYLRDVMMVNHGLGFIANRVADAVDADKSTGE